MLDPLIPATHSFGNWAVQRCFEATATVDERRKIVECMKYVNSSIDCVQYFADVLAVF